MAQEDEDKKSRAKVPLTAAIALLASVGGIGGGFGGGYYGAGGLPERVEKVEVKVTQVSDILTSGEQQFIALKNIVATHEKRLNDLENAERESPLHKLTVDVAVIKEQVRALFERRK